MGYLGSVSGLVGFIFLLFWVGISIWGGLVFFIELVNLFVLWLILFMSNFLRLFPYAWAFTINPLRNFVIMVGGWLVLRFYVVLSLGSVWTNRFMGHLLPMGTPIFLWRVLPLIEIISQVLRPITLTLRLSANLIAGHVLIFLGGQLTFLMGLLGLLILVPFEFMVSLVQSVVVYLLLFSYYSEL